MTKDEAWLVWRAGFMSSAEGWNGEYPFEYHRQDDLEDLYGDFTDWWLSLSDN